MSLSEEDLRNIVEKYIALDEHITKINKELKEQRNEKKELEETIKNFMIEKNLSKLDFNSDSFIIKETTKTPSLTKKTLVNELLTILDTDTVHNITEHVFSKEKETVSQIIERKKRK
jgi:uncharacterized protein (DUF2344 family)